MSFLDTWGGGRNGGSGSAGGAIASLGIGRLIVAGHSYAANPNDVFASHGTGQRDRRQWPEVLANIYGIEQSRRFWEVPIPKQAAAAADQETLLGILGQDSLIEAIAYFPAAAITGANTNYLQHYFQGPGLFGALVFSNMNWTAGRTAGNWKTAGAGVLLFYPFTGQLGSSRMLPRDSTDAYTSNAFGATEGVPFSVVQHQVGTGLADPGGIMVVRLGGSIRNVAVGGSQVTTPHVLGGGWACFFANQPLSAAPAVEVKVSATANIGATSISCDALNDAIASGTTIRFSNGATATLTATAALFATSLTVSALAAQVPVGSQGFADPGQGWYEGQNPDGLHVFNWGINDAGVSSLEVAPFREAMRACIAMALCSYFNLNAASSNFQYAAGNGAGAAWTSLAQPGLGQFNGTSKRFSGAVGATKPTITIQCAEAFEGGAIDLFFLAAGGASRGGSATILVDGANPPDGACVIDTRNLSSAVAVDSDMVVSTTSGSATITATTGTFSEPWDLGKRVTGAGIPAGAIISSVTDSTHAVISANATATATGVTMKKYTWVPMVKRLTGLSQGPHTILITIDNMSATDGSAGFEFLGWGWEARNPTGAVAVMNTAHIKNTTVYPVGNTDANVDTLNGELQALVAGAASTFGLNTVEPAPPNTVVIADIDAALNSDVMNFVSDGIHPNARGHMLMADAVAQAIDSVIPRQALISR